jgi:very-short-patch-repair endonuclease
MFGLKPLSRKKPLKRSRKRIAARAKFKAHGDNPLKTYRRRFTDYQVMVRAEIARQARLRDRTSAEVAFCGMLDDIGVLYESEKVFLNGDRFIIVDMYVKDAKIAFEIDGSAHDGQKGYDDGRDKWLLRVYRVRTIRFTNEQIFRERPDVRSSVIKELKLDRFAD